MPAASFHFPTSIKPAFDPVVEQCAPVTLSFTEEEALEETLWQRGEDGNLREDVRFRPTPWGRWILSDRYLANEAIYRALHREERTEQALSEALREVEEEVGRTCVFCTGDRRFDLREGNIRLSASELSNQPRVEEAGELERYRTHLPLHTIEAVAASAPLNEWGGRAQEDVIETLGWIRVEIPGRRLNDRMFVARIKGHSMDQGRRGLKDGAYALFELWPKGARSGKIVLVRGSFHDPETGNYALKQYQGEDRDENRERHWIRLVSLNPDKDHYPDIELTADEADDVEVVAEWLETIQPAHFARKAKPPRRKGRRDLASDEGRTKIERHLGKAVDRFFGAEARPAPQPGDRSGWAAHLVCLDLEAGGLHLETEALNDFPSFVKTVHLLSGEAITPVIASNLRNRSWRTRVTPWATLYRWTAPGFEEVLDEDLARLDVDGPDPSRVSAFRVDASGIGRLLGGVVLSPGQGYRLLLPPGTAMDPEGRSVGELGHGWQLWEMKLPASVPGPLRLELERLGFTLTKNRPQLEWIDTPSRYAANGAGEVFPVYQPQPGPVLRVTGIETGDVGELTLFVGGSGHAFSLPLPAGEDWWVNLEGLPPGSYGVEAIHRRMSVGRARLLFQISNEVPAWPAGEISLTSIEPSGETILEADPAGRIEWNGDLNRLALAEESPERLELVLKGPVYQRVPALWDDGRRRRVADLYLDESGRGDLAGALPSLADLARRNVRGILELDLGEMGLVTLHHTRDLSATEVFTFVREQWESRRSDVVKLRGQFPLLRSLWLDPILRLLYHGCRDLEPEILDSLPPESGALVYAVEEILRGEHGLARKIRRLIVLAPTEDGVWNAADSGLRDLADLACGATNLPEAVITEGLVWALYKPGRRVQPRPVDLRTVITEGSTSDFEDFLSDHAITL